MSSGKVIDENTKKLSNKLGLTQDDLAKKQIFIYYAYESQKRDG